MTANFHQPYCYECRDTGNHSYTGYLEDCRECGGYLKGLKQQQRLERELKSRSREIGQASWATEAERATMFADLLVI